VRELLKHLGASTTTSRVRDEATSEGVRALVLDPCPLRITLIGRKDVQRRLTEMAAEQGLEIVEERQR
jgi:hypothetical protein